MMLWVLIPIAALYKQYEENGYVSLSMAFSVALIEIYCVKFFIWEGGYFATIDIIHVPFGYYICWGVTSWIPTVYCLQWTVLARHVEIELSLLFAIALFVVGSWAIYSTLDVDLNRQIFRETQGQCLIWGKSPRYMEAYYLTEDGKQHKSLLLLSGGWEIARHWNYCLELIATFCWTAASKFSYFLPWFYFIFLIILLVDRTGRDEKRCRVKYGKYYDEYANAVPYLIFIIILTFLYT